MSAHAIWRGKKYQLISTTIGRRLTVYAMLVPLEYFWPLTTARSPKAVRNDWNVFMSSYFLFHDCGCTITIAKVG